MNLWTCGLLLCNAIDHCYLILLRVCKCVFFGLFIFIMCLISSYVLYIILGFKLEHIYLTSPPSEGIWTYRPVRLVVFGLVRGSPKPIFLFLVISVLVSNTFLDSKLCTRTEPNWNMLLKLGLVFCYYNFPSLGFASFGFDLVWNFSRLVYISIWPLEHL